MIRNFLADENGSVVESLVWSTIIGVGMLSIALGYYTANRHQTGAIANDFSQLRTPSSLPTPRESMHPATTGSLGGVTSISN